MRRSEVLDAHRERAFEIHEKCLLANDDERSPTTRRLELGAVAEIVVRIRATMNSGKDQYQPRAQQFMYFQLRCLPCAIHSIA